MGQAYRKSLYHVAFFKEVFPRECRYRSKLWMRIVNLLKEVDYEATFTIDPLGVSPIRAHLSHSCGIVGAIYTR